jgi:hypothetical protein
VTKDDSYFLKNYGGNITTIHSKKSTIQKPYLKEITPNYKKYMFKHFYYQKIYIQEGV